MSDSRFERFEPFMNGHFLLRRGPDFDAPEARRNQMKLCLTATDQTFLAEVLYEFSLNPRWGHHASSLLDAVWSAVLKAARNTAASAYQPPMESKVISR